MKVFQQLKREIYKCIGTILFSKKLDHFIEWCLEGEDSLVKLNQRMNKMYELKQAQERLIREYKDLGD